MIDSYFNDVIVPILDLIQIPLNDDCEAEIISLDKAISRLIINRDYLTDKRDILQKAINIKALNKTQNLQIFNEITKNNTEQSYVEISTQLEQFFGIVRNQKHAQEIINKINALIQQIQSFINIAEFFKTIIKCYLLKENNILKKNKKNIIFSNVSNLKEFVSEQASLIKLDINYKDFNNKKFGSQIEVLKSVSKEITIINNNLNNLLSSTKNNIEYGIVLDSIKYLINIFGESIHQIKTNYKCEILLNLDGKDCLVEDIISQCQKIEKDIKRLLVKKEVFMQLIKNCFTNKEFLALRKINYTENKEYAITNLFEDCYEYLKKLHCTTSLESPAILADGIKVIKDDKNYNYYIFLYEQIQIILENDQENYEFDVNKIKAVMRIFGLSIKAIGLSKSQKYVLYYNKSQAMTLDSVFKRLTRMQNKIKPYLSQTKLLLAIGEYSLKSKDLFTTLKQSYLIERQDVRSYINEYYNKLYENKLNSETTDIEIKEKFLAFKAVHDELTKVQNYAKYIADSFYQTHNQENTNFVDTNKNQYVENAPFYRSVHKLVLKNNAKNQIRLFFVSDEEKPYHTLSWEYSILNNLLDRLVQSAVAIHQDYEISLQPKPKIKEIDQPENQNIKNKNLFFIRLADTVGKIMCGLTAIYIFYAIYSEQGAKVSKAEKLVSNISSVDKPKNIEHLKKVQQYYNQAAILTTKENIPLYRMIHPEVKTKHDNYQQQIQNTNEQIRSEYLAVAQLQTASNLATSAFNLTKNQSYSLDNWEKAKHKLHRATQILASISTDTFVEAERNKKLQEYDEYYNFILARIVAESQDSELLTKAQNTMEEILKIVQNPSQPSETWKKVESMLVEVITALKDTSKNSSKYAELQKQLKRYEKFYIIVSKQAQAVEQFESSYNYGYNIAKELKEAGDKYPDNLSKLENALEQIESAISSLRTIPPNTSTYKQAQELIGTLKDYQQSITNHMHDIQSCNKAPSDYCGDESLNLTPPSPPN